MVKNTAHGFTTRKQWQDAFMQYYKSIHNIDEQNYDLMIHKRDCETWVHDFKEQALNIRAAYLTHDEFKQQHIDYFTKHPNHWTKEVADSLTAYLYRYWHRVEDIDILFTCGDALLDYYQKQDDEIQIMKCEMVLLSCYHYLDDMHFTNRCFPLCYDIIKKLKQHYDELNEEDRSIAMSVYDLWNIIRYENLVIDENLQVLFDEELYPQLQESVTMLERFMQEGDMTLDVNYAIPYILMNCKRMFAHIALCIQKDTLRSDQLLIIKTIAKEIYLDTSKSAYVYIQDEICYRMAFRFDTHDSNTCLMHSFMDKLENLDFPNEEKDTDKINEVLTMLEYFALMLKTLTKEDASISQECKGILEHYVRYILSLPYGKVMAHNVDQSVYNYLLPLLRYLEDTKEIFSILLNLTIFRQLQTAIHSRMVAKSATLILRHMIHKQPYLLLEQFDYTSIKEIQANEKVLLDFINQAAMLHDVGKILCTNVINTQYRKMIDVEFETIKFHPNSSSRILSQIPQLEKFHDIALGHHKSYDGKYGYPASFDTTHSKQKIFIDLIRICDSLDAATDSYGRLYAKPKTFESVLQELVLLKGSGYSPAIVALIEEDKDLQSELKALMEEGRESVYRDLYSMIKHNEFI